MNDLAILTFAFASGYLFRMAVEAQVRDILRRESERTVREECFVDWDAPAWTAEPRARLREIERRYAK